MADFKPFFKKLNAHEGEYADSPNDKGGETYRGIARNYHPRWAGWPSVDAAKKELKLTNPVPRDKWGSLNSTLRPLKALVVMVETFYKQLFWNSMLLDRVNSQSLAEQLADHGANAGVMRPAKMIQHLLRTEYGLDVVVDGQVGPKTVAAINSVSAAELYAHFLEMRVAFYQYRTGSWDKKLPVPAEWHAFFKQQLNLHTDTNQGRWLNSWLSRCRQKFVS